MIKGLSIIDYMQIACRSYGLYVFCKRQLSLFVIHPFKRLNYWADRDQHAVSAVQGI